MPDFVRVKDKDTGHEYSIVASAVLEEAHIVIDKPATAPDGTPLPAKHNLVAPKSLSSNKGGADSDAASIGQTATLEGKAK